MVFSILKRPVAWAFAIMMVVLPTASLLQAQIFTPVAADKESGAKVANQVEEQIGIYQTDEKIGSCG